MKVAILGLGGLGSALAHGLVGKTAALALADRHPEKRAAFTGAASLHEDPVEAARGADVVVLAVKPKATPALAAALSPVLGPDTLLVSCAAGVPVASLPGAAARAMPSIGASRGASTTAVFLGPRSVPERDRPRLFEVFAAVGEVREVPDEAWLHPITAIAASGPAFLLVAVEALVDAGIEAGLPRAEALAYGAGALTAAAARLEDGVEPAALRAQITSPAGTTVAGLAVLERGAVRAAFLDAVRAATARSLELAALEPAPREP
jgi:pyrroline-5-carboxylate reductase